MAPNVTIRLCLFLIGCTHLLVTGAPAKGKPDVHDVEHFNRMDINKDSQIDFYEICKGHEAYGIKYDDLKKYFEECNTDGNYGVSFPEYEACNPHGHLSTHKNSSSVS